MAQNSSVPTARPFDQRITGNGSVQMQEEERLGPLPSPKLHDEIISKAEASKRVDALKAKLDME